MTVPPAARPVVVPTLSAHATISHVEVHEREWLRYAWSVVGCGSEHATRCEAAGGIGIPGGGTARFPGFVGPGYQPGRGVLCLAHVHRYLPAIDDVAGGRLAAIETAIVGWAQRGRNADSDATFLAESRPAYMDSAAEWPWWKKHYGELLKKARVPMAEVAFANFAKCRTPTEEESSASIRLARLCAEVYPPRDLVRLLDPVAVLVASLQLDLGDVGDVLVVRWNGRNGLDDEGNRMSTWLPLQASRIHRRRM